MGFDTTVMVRSICLRHFDQVSENKKNVIEPTLNLLNQTVVYFDYISLIPCIKKEIKLVFLPVSNRFYFYHQ